MIRRLLILYFGLATFYVAAPVMLGFIAPGVAAGCLLLLLGTLLAIWPVALIQARSCVNWSFKEALEVCYWASLAASVYISLTVLFSGVAGLSRNELFELRTRALNPTIVILLNLGMVSAALLSREAPSRMLWFSGPIFFEFLTQSRSFILAGLLVVLARGGMPKKYLAIAIAMLIGVSLSRMGGDLNVSDVLLYFFGESFNTALGSLLVDSDHFSVSYPQAMRPILAFFPFVGGLIGIDSEAVSYNHLLKEQFDVYGLAFGVVGYYKFSSVGVIVVGLLSGCGSLLLLRALGASSSFILLLCAAQLPMYFRWSPAEYFYLIARATIVFLAIQCVIFLLRQTEVVAKTH